MSQDAPKPLAPAETQHLTEFARACKAAARAVTLYPASHPTIVTNLGRIAQLTSPQSLAAPLKITVLANELRVNGRAPSRPDGAIGELASLLHDHLIGELTISPGGDVGSWRNFLLLLGRSPDDVRAEGGLPAFGRRPPAVTRNSGNRLRRRPSRARRPARAVGQHSRSFLEATAAENSAQPPGCCSRSRASNARRAFVAPRIARRRIRRAGQGETRSSDTASIVKTVRKPNRRRRVLRTCQPH